MYYSRVFALGLEAISSIGTEYKGDAKEV